MKVRYLVKMRYVKGDPICSCSFISNVVLIFFYLLLARFVFQTFISIISFYIYYLLQDKYFLMLKYIICIKEVISPFSLFI